LLEEEGDRTESRTFLLCSQLFLDVGILFPFRYLNVRNFVGWSVGLESLLILARVDLGNDLLQLSLGLALREVIHVVVLRCNPDEPLRLDVGAGPDVVLGGQHKLVVQNPFRLVVETGGGVKLDHLVILDR